MQMERGWNVWNILKPTMRVFAVQLEENYMVWAWDFATPAEYGQSGVEYAHQMAPKLPETHQMFIGGKFESIKLAVVVLCSIYCASWSHLFSIPGIIVFTIMRFTAGQIHCDIFGSEAHLEARGFPVAMADCQGSHPNSVACHATMTTTKHQQSNIRIFPSAQKVCQMTSHRATKKSRSTLILTHTYSCFCKQMHCFYSPIYIEYLHIYIILYLHVYIILEFVFLCSKMLDYRW